jgi:hypothetical protein
LFSHIFNHDAAGAGSFGRGRTASLAFPAGAGLVDWRVLCGQAQMLGAFSMAMSLLVSRLSVVAAYVAFAFVGAIVLGLL